jgi:hypothetical protein
MQALTKQLLVFFGTSVQVNGHQMGVVIKELPMMWSRVVVHI